MECIPIRRLHKISSTGAQLAPNSRQPSWKTTSGSFGIDVRTRPSDEIDASLLCSVEEGIQVKNPFRTERSRLALEQCPVNIERHGVESQGLDLLEHIQI